MKAPRSRASRAVAAVAGASALVTSWSGVLAAFAPAAEAAPAPDQDVLNDWGQTAAEVTEEVNLVVDADVDVIAARTRYLHALSTYASLKQSQKVAVSAHNTALKTRTTRDDVTTARTLADRERPGLRRRPRGGRVAAGHGEARERPHRGRARAALHPGTAGHAPHRTRGPHGGRRVGQISLTWTAVSGATGYRVYRDGVQIASTASPTFLDTGLDNGTPYGYSGARDEPRRLVAEVRRGRRDAERRRALGARRPRRGPGRRPGHAGVDGDAVGDELPGLPQRHARRLPDQRRRSSTSASPTRSSYSYTVKALNGAAASAASAAVSVHAGRDRPRRADEPRGDPRQRDRDAHLVRVRRCDVVQGLPRRRRCWRRRPARATSTRPSPTGRPTPTRSWRSG